MRSSKFAELLKNVPRELKENVEEGVTILEQHSLSNVRARVCAVVDISGSMADLAANGKLQRLFNKFFSLGILFDDNQEIEVFLLGGSNPYGVFTVNKNNFSRFIAQINQQYGFKSATNYDIPVKEVLSHYFPRNQKENWRTEDPVFCAFLTDGAPYPIESGERAKKLIHGAAENGVPIFFKFLALDNGTCNFGLLQSIDDDNTRLFDNTDFVNVKRPEDLTMQDLINEFRGFLLEVHKRQFLLKDYGIPANFLYGEDRVLARDVRSAAVSGSANAASFYPQRMFPQPTIGNKDVDVAKKAGQECKCVIQ